MPVPIQESSRKTVAMTRRFKSVEVGRKNCTIQILKTMVDLCIFMPGKWRFLSKGCVCIVLNKTSIVQRIQPVSAEFYTLAPATVDRADRCWGGNNSLQYWPSSYTDLATFSLWLKRFYIKLRFKKLRREPPPLIERGRAFFWAGAFAPSFCERTPTGMAISFSKNLFYQTSWANWHSYPHIPLQF